MKGIIILFMLAGSFAGSYLPVLWGASLFSLSSVLFGAIGGLVGIGAGFKAASWMNLE